MIDTNFTHILSHLPGEFQDIIYKVTISILLGFIIGLERELTNKSAGLRTHMLVCLGSTIFTLLSISGFSTYMLDPMGNRIPNDPARISAQIVAGIGFIGGGAVLRNGTSILGLTTAASLWISASIGMAVGCGAYELAAVATILSIAVLVFIRILERNVLAKHTKKGCRIKATIRCKNEHTSKIKAWFYSEFPNIVEMDVKPSTAGISISKLTFLIDVFEINPIHYVYVKIEQLEHVEQLTLQQISDE